MKTVIYLFVVLLMFITACKKEVSVTEPSPETNTSESPGFWYEDNNVHQAGGAPADFPDLFRHPEKWSLLRGKISVYLIRGNTLNNVISVLGEKFVTDTMAPVLVNDNIKLAIDNPQGNFEDIYNLLKGTGLTISHVGLQSALSKPREVSPQFDPELQGRIEEVKSRILSFHQFAPEIKYGIIDARPTKGWEYENAYKRLFDALDATNHKLDFIMLDCPYSYPAAGDKITWAGLKAVEQYVQHDLGIEYGLIITDNVGGMSGEKEFFDSVMSYGENYIKTGTVPDYFVLMSWFNHPALSLPENAPVGSCPMTKVGLHLFSYLESLYFN
jgi:hypothetical protein